MDWFCFVNIIPLHAENHRVSEKFPGMMSTIQKISLFSVTLVIVDDNIYMTVVNLVCLCFHHDSTFCTRYLNRRKVYIYNLLPERSGYYPCRT